MSKKRGLSVVIAALAAVVGGVLLQRTFAATGQMYLQPSSVSVNNGSSFTVEVRINPGAATNGVEATVTYDKTKMQFLSLDPAGTAYPTELPGNSGGNGTVQISRGHLTGTVSANGSLVAKIKFKALVGSGSAALSLAGNATAAGAYTNPATSGGSVTFKTPVAPAPAPKPPASTPTPTPSTPDPKPSSESPSTSSEQEPAATPKTEPNQPSTTGAGRKIELSKLQFKKVEFKISADKPFRAYIKYGIDGKANVSTPQTKFAKEHTVKLDEKLLLPGTTYTYVVVTEGQDGKVEETPKQTLKTKGITVRVTVLGKNNKPLKNQLVTLHSEPLTSRTDGSGMASFENVSPGVHTLEYLHDGKTLSQTVQVDDNIVVSGAEEVASPQTFSVVFGEVDAGMLSPLVMAALVGLLVVIAFGLFLAKSGKLAAAKNRFNRPGPTSGVGPMGPGSGTVVGGPGGAGGPPSGDSADVDKMLAGVRGGKLSNPGTVITPNETNKEDWQ